MTLDDPLATDEPDDFDADEIAPIETASQASFTTTQSRFSPGCRSNSAA